MNRTTRAAVALAALALALAACSQRHPTAAAEASSHPHASKAASAIAADPATRQAEATAKACTTLALRAPAHPAKAWEGCFQRAYPSGHGRAAARCFGLALLAYLPHHGQPAAEATLNSSANKCVQDNR